MRRSSTARRCPVTYRTLDDTSVGESPPAAYSREGLRRLSRTLLRLDALPHSAAELRRGAAAGATRSSIPGVQPKLGARLDVKRGRFEIVAGGGTYILKPQHLVHRHVPENEALTMHLAGAVGIEVPVHGLVRSADGSWTYFVRRFDRMARGRRLAVEDFAQLTGHTRETKYDSSMEEVAAVIERHATFPAVEKLDLFRRTIFCFLTGNEDMHLKNFSLVVRGARVQLSPAYDLVSTTLVLEGTTDELALPLCGKERKLTRSDLVDRYGRERLGIAGGAIDDALAGIAAAMPTWEATIRGSFLPEDLRQAYLALLRERRARLGL